jgi:hypothetical protein
LTSLEKSNFEDQLTALQAGNDIKYKIHGDSAYYDNKNLGTGGGRGMASVRETVEWTFKDDKGLWKYLDYKHVLKLHNQPVAKIMFVCMLLRNAYVTMNGSQVSEYLISLPQSFEHWDRPRGPYVIIQSSVMILFMILMMTYLMKKMNLIDH